MLNLYWIFLVLKELEFIAKEAGQIILNYYDNSDMGISVKSDGSPVTQADLGSEKHIVLRLKNKFSYPITPGRKFFRVFF